MTLRNKLSLDNPVELARLEEKLSKQKAIELWHSGELKNPPSTFRRGKIFLSTDFYKTICAITKPTQQPLMTPIKPGIMNE